MSNGPLLVFQWKDDEPTGATGFYVVDRIINNVCGGGITMGVNITQQEVEDVARSMSNKFTITSPNIGGGKGGIRFDPQDPRSRSVLRRYLISMKQLFITFVNTAGDIGTDDSFVQEVFQQDLGLQTCQSALATMIAQKTGQPNLDFQLAKLISFPANEHFALIEAAVGFGLLAAIRTVSKYIPQPSLSSTRIAIQGFGAVGSSLAYYAHQHNGMAVSALSDKDGFVIANECLPIEKFLEIRSRHKNSLPEGSHKQEVGKNFFQSLLFEYSTLEKIEEAFGVIAVARSSNSTDEQYLCQFLSQATADVFCPCAGRYAITEAVINVLEKNTWRDSTKFRCIAPGANNPFVKNDVDLSHYLATKNVCVIPDYVANCGTAQLFHRGLSVPFDLQSPSLAQDVLFACAEPIAQYITTALSNCYESELSKLPEACALVTAERLRNPLPVTGCDTVQFHFPPLMQDERKEGPNYVSAVEKTQRALNGLILTGEKKLASLQQAEGDSKDDACPLPNATSYYAYPPMTEFADGYTTVEERIAKVLALGIECINPSELEALMRDPNANLVAYDGFEPSGRYVIFFVIFFFLIVVFIRMHIAQGLMKKHIVNELTACGFTFIFWIADFFAALNLKQGGDMNKIRALGLYFQEIWRSCGMNTQRVRFLWAFDEIMKRPKEYLNLVFDISTKFNLHRIRKSVTALGRSEDEKNLQASQFLYPLFQAADVFFLEVSVCQLGLDQRFESNYV